MHAIYENHYLTDQDVANFARQSFGKYAKNFTKVNNDNLVKFLARGMSSDDWEALITTLGITDKTEDLHSLANYIRSIPEHWVPFAHPQITLRMRAPVPITVQCYKHKVGFVESGESRRYVKSTPTFYMPDTIREAAENVKQGSGGTHYENREWLEAYKAHMESSIDLYEHAISEGVCPEQARFLLPQGVELNWVWTGSLYAYANFFNQRTDPHSQKEIQILAKQVGDIIEPLFPVSWAALTQGKY